MIIDTYSHFCPADFVSELVRMSSANSILCEFIAKNVDVTKHFGRFPQFTDVKTRVQHLDKYHIDKQVTGMNNLIDPNVLPMEIEEVGKLCHMFNDGMAEAMRKADGRVITTASVPLASPDMETEMDRAIKDLGLKGVFVPSHVHGKPIDKFTSLWDKAERLDVPVWIHPADPESVEGRPYEAEYDLTHSFGWPFETTLMASRLVFSGTMERHPRLKIVLHHLGAYISFMSGRISETYGTKPITPQGASYHVQLKNVQLKKAPIEYYKMFYCDTAVGGYAEAVRCGLEVFGADHVIFATDYPWGPEGGERRLATYPGVLQEIMDKLGVPKGDQEKIKWKNTTSLLRL